MPDKVANYFSFLIRLWRDDEHTPWRALLEDPHTGRTYQFSSPERMFAFLADRMQNGSGNEKSLPTDEL